MEGVYGLYVVYVRYIDRSITSIINTSINISTTITINCINNINARTNEHININCSITSTRTGRRHQPKGTRSALRQLGVTKGWAIGLFQSSGFISVPHSGVFQPRMDGITGTINTLTPPTERWKRARVPGLRCRAVKIKFHQVPKAIIT